MDPPKVPFYPLKDRKPLKIRTIEEHTEPPYTYDLPRVNNRRSFVESPPEMYNSEFSWPLTSSTSTSHSSLWPHEKSLPPTPSSRSRGLSLSRRPVPDRTSLPYSERPASWNPTAPADFQLNLDRAILGTSLARDHRATRDEEQQAHALESIFNTLKIAENRRNTWDERQIEAQRQRSVMNRIVNERNLNPSQFETSPKHARYFVIKSYNVVSLEAGLMVGRRCT